MHTEPNFDFSASKTRQISRCTKIKQTLKNHVRFIGPGLVASVAYCDPGNWATDLGAGSSHGYAHLFVILSASLMASVLQVLATRLGFITGKDLAQHCRDRFYDRPNRKLLWRWGVLYPLYFLCEGGIIFTDLAELLGSAIALHMLFPRLPLFVGVLLTSMDVFVVLAFFSSYPDVSNKNRKTMHIFELFVALLIFIVMIFFVILLVSVKPEWGKTFEGFIPNRRMIVNGGLYVSVSLIGATVMPHSIFLGSKVAIPERLRDIPVQPGHPLPQNSGSLHLGEMDKAVVTGRGIPVKSLDIESRLENEVHRLEATVVSVERTKTHLAHASFDIVASLLTLALPVNASILIVAAATFYYGSDTDGKKGESLDLESAYELLGSQVGPIAGYLFAIALLIAGQAASITVTLAGQIVSEGFLEWRTRPVIRRLVTRMIGIVPSAVVAGAAGLQGVDQLLVGSQVGLSLVLPFVLAPLIIFTSDPEIMRVKSHKTALVRIEPNQTHPQLKVTRGITQYEEVNIHMKNEALDSADGPTMSFANGRIMKIATWVIFVLCSVSNIYAIIQLSQGQL
ncbi:hypothetical protein Pst134EA_015954 [Puccinia striiformis f. sp. tritici]|uniref:Uncharacterized protein n=1 Tax=Puccinia striiformis f. sp. tritici PST-78 TaxID=1165861 RepID=A0A0L0UXY2_9BASI|nr:hypothetical protein Pst134EA_015954 [Puccinia striiformis f. sp. tritici]KAH9463874.1 hypothetical protein Pst134EA_015954 [Puccinia striiformis f. sp. tritici]KAI9605326.1 hypothetical protein KEM48_002266 [Puccinia striiformis f. sp. tritici PST-130]KNE91786.1 hypothetical protein PSTG_14803 [Puccinia striiformis f. sp. tritici PST-78]